MKRFRAFTLIELLIVVAIIAILAAIAVPNFMEAQVRAKVARVNSDQRSLATAIESYRIDNNAIPPWGNCQTMNAGLPSMAVSVYDLDGDNFWHYYWLWTFMTPNDDFSFHCLSTPVSYITSIPYDPFAISPVGPYGYYGSADDPALSNSDEKSNAWLLYSFGPNRYYELNHARHGMFVNRHLVEGFDVPVLSQEGANPTIYLLTGIDGPAGDTEWTDGAFTYDPTNGTRSDGCVWRVGP